MRGKRNSKSLSGPVIIFISILLLLFISEIYLRSNWTNYWKNAGRVITLCEQIPQDSRVYTRDKRIIKEGGVVKIEVDDDGFIKPGLIQKDGSRLITIAYLGGSTIECFWITDTLRFPYLAGKMISDMYNVSVRVLNAGFGATNTQHSINVLLNKVINYDPDIVVMMQAVNDASVLTTVGDYRSDMIKAPHIRMIDILSKNCYVAAFLRHIKARHKVNRERVDIALETMKKSDSEPYLNNNIKAEDLNKALEQFSTRLKIFIDSVRDMNATPVLMTQPYCKINKPAPAGKDRTEPSKGINFMDVFNDKIREVALSKKCDIIDLDKELARDSRYFYDWLHCTDAGSQRIAEIVFSHLKDIVSRRLETVRDNQPQMGI